MGYTAYAVKSDTNLLKHINSHHSDLASQSAYQYQQPTKFQPAQPQKRNSVPPPSSDYLDDDIDPTQFIDEDDDVIPASVIEASLSDMKNPPKVVVGTKYIEDIVKMYQPGVECTICFEEFKVSESIARLDCFCTFHKRCIDLWFEKSHKCPLHKD